MNELISFEKHPYLKEIIQVRANDEKAKIMDFKEINIDSFDCDIESVIDSKLDVNSKNKVVYICDLDNMLSLQNAIAKQNILLAN